METARQIVVFAYVLAAFLNHLIHQAYGVPQNCCNAWESARHVVGDPNWFVSSGLEQHTPSIVMTSCGSASHTARTHEGHAFGPGCCDGRRARWVQGVAKFLMNQSPWLTGNRGGGSILEACCPPPSRQPRGRGAMTTSQYRQTWMGTLRCLVLVNAEIPAHDRLRRRPP